MNVNFLKKKKSLYYKNYLEGWLKYKLLSYTSRVSDLADLGWGLKIYFTSNKFLRDADAADVGYHTLRPTALEPCRALGYPIL